MPIFSDLVHLPNCEYVSFIRKNEKNRVYIQHTHRVVMVYLFMMFYYGTKISKTNVFAEIEFECYSYCKSKVINDKLNYCAQIETVFICITSHLFSFTVLYELRKT